MTLGLTEAQLDSIVTDAEAAITLGCEDRLGKITYREALDNYNKRLVRFMDFVDDLFGEVDK